MKRTIYKKRYRKKAKTLLRNADRLSRFVNPPYWDEEINFPAGESTENLSEGIRLDEVSGNIISINMRIPKPP
jgi:hypothetical protein